MKNKKYILSILMPDEPTMVKDANSGIDYADIGRPGYGNIECSEDEKEKLIDKVEKAGGKIIGTYEV